MKLTQEIMAEIIASAIPNEGNSAKITIEMSDGHLKITQDRETARASRTNVIQHAADAAADAGFIDLWGGRAVHVVEYRSQEDF